MRGEMDVAWAERRWAPERSFVVEEEKEERRLGGWRVQPGDMKT